MNRILVSLLALVLTLAGAQSAEPLRVFIRAGAKTHGPDQHDHPRFLAKWAKLLNERGARADGGMDWPNADQLAHTDVVVMYAADAGNFTPEQKTNLEAYLKRGGGLVVLHDAVCGNDAARFKTVIGGAWQHGKAKWFEGEISLYYAQSDSPIIAGASNFDLDDEMYYELDMMPEAKVLASTWTPDERAKKNGRAFPHIYQVAPQMWTYETGNHRAFVSIPGHHWKTFELPHYRAVLLRGIAWAGKRANVDELCSPQELASLRYPTGGPSRPADALAKLDLHPDFKISLVAAEPLINKPMNIDWDAAGRLWVAETPEYPNGRRGMRPEEAGREWRDQGGLVPQTGVQDRPGFDRISYLTDTDGDGVMDQKQVFADGLELVTGLVFHRDGVIVTQAPDVLWLRDTNSDGKADKVEKLYTGLGTGDTHAVINNPRWGFDGWIYATHGYSGSRDVTSGDGAKHFGPIGSGVVRFKPDGSAMEQFSSKGGNTWGLTVTADNEIVWTQPTSGDLVMHTVLSEAQLSRGKLGKTPSFKVITKSPKAFPAMSWGQQAYRQIDWVGSFTAAAGTVIYDGGTWPAEYHGDYFTTEPTINIVHHERIKPDGVSFAGFKLPGREETEFITSRDLWFRPIEVRGGPDGAMYVVDFYNQAVIHNDTRGPAHNKVNAALRPDRDHYFGRIYRVDHKQAKAITVPNLATADEAELVAALEHTNKAVRFTAHRLLAERGSGAELLQKIAGDEAKPTAARIHALWILHLQKQLDPTSLASGLKATDPAVRRNALRVVANGASAPDLKALTALVTEADPRTQLAALLALGSDSTSAEAAGQLIGGYSELQDDWSRSAAIAAMNRAPLANIEHALRSTNTAPILEPATRLAAGIAVRGDGAELQRLVTLIALSEGADPKLVSALLTSTASSIKAGTSPAWTAELQQAFGKLLQGEAGASALPLVVAWDKQGTLAPQVKALSDLLVTNLQDPAASDDQRIAALTTLLATGRNVQPSITAMLASPERLELRQRVLAALGDSPDAANGALIMQVFPKLEPALQNTALTQLLKRPEWTHALIAGIREKSVAMQTLGAIGLDRLRNHPDKAIAKEAQEAIQAVMGPQIAEKNKIIAQFLPQVELGGDVVNGKAMFTAACAVCHKFNGEGNPVGPELTGMGAHPRAELLTHIVDPNREVDPSFAAWSVELKDGNAYVGVITRENAQSVTIRDQAAEHDVPKATVARLTAMGRSLMPEGLEALGAGALRDILAYLETGGGRFRIIDMSPAATADGRLGLFSSKEALSDNLEFKKYGSLQIGDVPFRVSDPAQSATGKNLVVLKGGSGFAKTHPQKVEIAVPKVQANALHFLGGVAGWGFPWGSADRTNAPAARVTIAYAGGKSEMLELKNGVEFADYMGHADVPGSVAAPLVDNHKQVRVFRKPLQIGGAIEKITIESADNFLAPVFAAITAEQANAGSPPANQSTSTSVVATPAAAAPAPSTAAASNSPQAPTTASGVRALIVGGGSSHDFAKWFGDVDKNTLSALQPAWIHYTENVNNLALILANIDVLVWSANQSLSNETRAALMEFVAAGKGLIVLHPGIWYNWNNFPQWNKEIIGGGSRGHDKYGDFDVELLEPNHPLLVGVPPTFRLADELYHSQLDPAGAATTVLAQSTSPASGKTFPQVWTVAHPKSRIICITLGHDGPAHNHPAYQTLLKNAFLWAAKR